MKRGVLALVLCVALGAPAVARAQQQTPAPDVGIDQRLDEPLPTDLAFRDEAGRPVTLAELANGKPLILVLAYYRCPRLCSLVLNGLVECLRQVRYTAGEDFVVVVVSIDPRETPELAAAKKAAYAEHYGRPGAAAGWHFLTGVEPAIRKLAAAAGFRYRYDAEREQYAHASGILVVTPAGKIARYFFGVQFSPRDVGFALEDASAGKVGSPVATSLRLLCFAYDPATGKYTLLTMRLVRAASAVTVLGLGIVLWRAWRRERRGGPATPTSAPEV